MARKKGTVIGVEDDSKVEPSAPEGVGSLDTPSAFLSTSSTNPACPHCDSIFRDTSTKDFRNHVASCTQPSTAGDDASSILTTPPVSPSQPSQLLSSSGDVGEGAQHNKEAPLSVADVQEVFDNPDSEQMDDPRPYLNPGTEFEYYDQTEQPEQTELQEGSDDQDRQNVQKSHAGEKENITQNLTTTENSQEASEYPQNTNNTSDAGEDASASQNPPPSTLPIPDASDKALESIEVKRYPFAKFTDVEIFEKYLENPEDMSYDELYRRTARVSEALKAYQNEWDAIDKEIYEHESNEKIENKRIEEETKAMLEEERLKDDAEREEVAEEFKLKLKLSSKKWQEFIAEIEDSTPDKTLRHLQNLRNPQFMAAARKKERAAINKAKNLLNAPWPETKKTKEDLEWERRQRGRYMDPVKFDDMKQADAYGFEYSAHIKHYGQQPTAIFVRQVNLNPNPATHNAGDDVIDTTRSRTQRNTTRKKYGDDASATPEESAEEDGQKLQKRIRKPKIYIDGIETDQRSRGQSRSGTPVVRTFKSGKRVGRPPAKSKLQAVQLAQPSTTPEVASGNEGLIANSRNELEHPGLLPSQEAQLHDAAESLVNHTQNGEASGIVPKRRGRKKIQRDVLVEAPEVAAAIVPLQRKRKHAGGRPRKNNIPDIQVDADEDLMQSAPKRLKTIPKKRGRPVKKEVMAEDDLVQLGEENVLQSTEQDDGSDYTSAVTSRPTTSDSNNTNSTFGSRRSARPSTREKTNAREARASLNRRGSVAAHTSFPTSTRSKRKRASSETDPSPIVVEPLQSVEPVAKKHKTRGKQPDYVLDGFEEADIEDVPEASTSRSTKRKRDNTINESIAVVGPIDSAPINFAPPPKKARRRVKAEEETQPDVEELDPYADIDEDSLDPEALKALKKQRIKDEKSRKLSESMKSRWASGGMADAQKTRKANNAIKRAHKEKVRENLANGLPPPPPPVLLGTQPKPNTASASALALTAEPDLKEELEDENETDQEAEYPTETQGTATSTPVPVAVNRKRTKGKPKTLPPKRPASTRTRKPTRVVLGFDGANDEDEEDEEEDGDIDDGEDEDEDGQPFTSEYDQFQALSSPRKPVLLGKRVRKSLVDLSQYMDSGDEEDFSG